jgi:hypothetical protein
MESEKTYARIARGELPPIIRLSGVSSQGPCKTIKTLSSAISVYGGWVLSHAADSSGLAAMLFEFRRRVIVDIYCVMIVGGIELSRGSHFTLTELCRYAFFDQDDFGDDILSIELKARTELP